MNNGEMKVADVRNWVLNNMFNNGNPSNHDMWVANMLEKNYSVDHAWGRTLEGAWLNTWEVELIFKAWFEDGAWAFRAMECDVTTYVKDNPAIEPSIF